MPWEVILVDEVIDWYQALPQGTADSVTAAIDMLAAIGPLLGRPLVDTLQGTELKNLKELRPGSEGRSEIRILFAFDPDRRAVLLVAGNKAGRWKRWYAENIPVAEERYRMWLNGDYDEVKE